MTQYVIVTLRYRGLPLLRNIFYDTEESEKGRGKSKVEKKSIVAQNSQEGRGRGAWGGDSCPGGKRPFKAPIMAAFWQDGYMGLGSVHAYLAEPITLCWRDGELDSDGGGQNGRWSSACQNPPRFRHLVAVELSWMCVHQASRWYTSLQ